MTDPIVGDSARDVLARSFHSIQSHREQIIDAMRDSLVASEATDDPFGQSEVTALLLVDMLLAAGRNLIDRGEALTDGMAASMLSEHRSQGIQGRHYSRFGDALVAVLRDVLGPQLPGAVSATWCDTFWSVVRHLVREDEPVAA